MRRAGGISEQKQAAGAASRATGRSWADGSSGRADGSSGSSTVDPTSGAASVLARVRDARNALGLTGEIVPFGSHVNGFSTPSSDCDLSYMPPEGNTNETPIRVLQRFATELPNHGFDGIITIFQALIPIVKAIDPSGIEVDLCVGNLLGLQNSKLVAAYCSLDPRVGALGRHVKNWAKAWELVGSSDGHLTSYAYTLLTIYFLMSTRPPVVPNLQDLAAQGCESVIVKDKRWGREIGWDCKFWCDVHLIPKSQNSASVETLLHAFFEFYASRFDWHSNAVSIRTGLTTQNSFTSKFGLVSSVQKEQWYVEDPFDLRHNLASQCTRDGRQRILDKMTETLQVLANTMDDVITCFTSHCSRAQTSFMLKCRVHTEKVTSADFVKAFSFVANVQPFDVWFPQMQGPRVREVMDAFLVFQRDDDRRRVHRMNETYVGEWQLRLLPCSTWALEDARASTGYEELKISPQSPPTPPDGEDSGRAHSEAAAEEVRSGLRVAQTPQEVKVLIERAQAIGLSHEEMLGKKKLKELQKTPDLATEEPTADVRFQ